MRSLSGSFEERTVWFTSVANDADSIRTALVDSVRLVFSQRCSEKRRQDHRMTHRFSSIGVGGNFIGVEGGATT